MRAFWNMMSIPERRQFAFEKACFNELAIELFVDCSWDDLGKMVKVALASAYVS